MNHPEPRTGASLLRMAAWGGLAYGLVEASEAGLLSLVPGALSWRTGNAPAIFWVAPLVYLVAFGLVGAVASLLSRAWRRPAWDQVLFAALVFIGAWLAASLQGQILSPLAALILALGFAVALTRHYRKHATAWQELIRRTLVPLAALVLLLMIGITGWGSVRERLATGRLAAGAHGPNVLLIVLDTQRADHMSLYGYGRPTTPELERFAREGTVFDRAIASSSWTLPTHASLMTGRPLHEHRAGIMRRPWMDDRYPTLAEALADRGYVTAGFVANTFWTGRQTHLDRGFIHYEDFFGKPADAVARTVLGRKLAYDWLPHVGLHDVPGRKWAPDINGDFLGWLDGQDGDRPFFAFLNYFDVHSPLFPTAPYAGTFSPPGGKATYDRLEIGALAGEMELPPPEQLRALVDAYDESILMLDASLGALFDSLRTRGILDSTIVIVTADHGESWGEHGLMYHGHSLYADQVHVPLVIRWPGRVPGGERVARPVGLEQVARTVEELTGADLDAPGPDLFTLGDEPVMAELARRSAVPAGWPASRGSVASIVTGRWQFIQEESGASELYDMATDPHQLQNLAGDPDNADLVAGFSTGLRHRLGGTALSWPDSSAEEAR